MRNLYLMVMNKLYCELQRAHRKYIGSLYRNASNVVLGENVKFPYIESGVPSCGKIEVGDNSWIGGIINMFPHNKDAVLKIGKDCYIGDGSRIWCAKSITIGDRVLIAHNVNIFDTATHPVNKKTRYEHEKIVKQSGLPKKKYSEIAESSVVIKDDVWIGCNSIILKGTEIGQGAIVAAGSVVTKNVPPDTMVAGNPAKVVKKLSKE